MPMLRTKRNRRKVQLGKKAAELRDTARAHSSLVLKVGAAALALGALAVGAKEGWAWAQVSPRYAVTDVRFTGLNHAKTDELLKLSGLSSPQNLFKLDTQAAERAILSQPWVKQATVRRSLPNRVDVAVTEHEAVAMVALGELYLMNADGAPFKRVQPGDDIDLPLITGLDRERYLSHPDESRERLQHALSVADQYEQAVAGKEQAISEVRVSDEGVAIVTATGQEVRLGEGEVSGKLNALQRVRAELAQRSLNANVIRLDNRTRPDWVTVQLSK